jgi:signal transduction histidine kinase
MKMYLSALLVSLALTFPSHADEGGTRDEAHQMAARAAQYLHENGPEKAFEAFGQSGAPFHDRDLYVIVFDKTGKNVAHGAIPGQVGKNLIDLKDIDGVPFVQQMVAVKGEGVVTYKWPNPQSKQVQKKTVFVEEVDGYVVGVGTYAQ